MPEENLHKKADSAYMTLDSVINNVINDEYGASEHNYMRYLQWGIRGVKKFNFDIISSFKAIELPITATGTIDLPKDFVDYITVGIIADGRVRSLTRNDKMHMANAINDCGQKVLTARGTNSRQVPGIFEDAGWYFYNYRNGQNLGQIFGYGGIRDNEGYRIDKEAGIIQFTSNLVGATIYIEYASDGLTYNGDTLVHVHAEEALIQWIHWQRLRFKPGTAVSHKQEAERGFIKEYKLATQRMRSFTGQEFLDAVRRNYHQAIKN